MQRLLHHKERYQLLELAEIVTFNFHILIVLFFWLKEHITPSFPSLPAASEIDEMQGSKEHSPCNVPTSFEEDTLCNLLLCLPCGYQIMPSAFVLQKEIPLYSLKYPKAGIQKLHTAGCGLFCFTSRGKIHCLSRSTFFSHYVPGLCKSFATGYVNVWH